MDEYFETLNDIEEMAGGLKSAYLPAMRFMIETCGKMALSDCARESLAVAVRYLDGAVSASELKAARINCWHSIKGRDCDFSDPEVAATRAVICTLKPQDHDSDLFETLDFFEGVAREACIEPRTLWSGCETPLGC